MNFSFYVKIILRGVGQIMLQENAITGLFFLAGLFYVSISMGLAALLATIIGTVTAYILKYNKEEIEKGLYGFNAALIGVAVLVFCKPTIISFVVIIIGSIISTFIFHFFLQRKIPVFTFPFVVITWLIVFIFHTFFVQHLNENIALPNTPNINYLSLTFKGFGQVIFQENMVASILFFVAVFISSPISALYGLAASFIAGVVAFSFSFSIQEINMGLLGYNAVLCAIVFAGNKLHNYLLAFVSILLALLISTLMFTYNITQLTFPFVASTCIILFFKQTIQPKIAKI